MRAGSLACAFGSCPCPRSSEYPRRPRFLSAFFHYFTILVAFPRELFPASPARQQWSTKSRVHIRSSCCCCYCCDRVVHRTYLRTVLGVRPASRSRCRFRVFFVLDTHSPPLRNVKLSSCLIFIYFAELLSSGRGN